MLCDLNTIENVKKFTDICNKYDSLNIKIYSSDGYIVDGKSIMGVFSLDLTKKLRVIAEQNKDFDIALYQKFYDEIRRFACK